jgi:class 3 adenylate cyclase
MNEKKTILIVDDTPENIQVLSGVLSEKYHIKAATSGEKALKICSADPVPDLILLDVMMPDMSGHEVCSLIKQDSRLCGIPVIFVTAMSEEEDESRGFQLGAVDYITKPIKPAVVMQRINSQIELAGARAELVRLGKKYSSYLSPELARSIECGEINTAVNSSRKKLTIFFSDIQGFTQQTSKLEPEDLSILLNSYLEAMNEVIAKYNGTLDKYIGDAILVFFGDPHTKGLAEDARACGSMALEMQSRILELRNDWRKQGIADPLQVRIGITTGFCTVGNFGSSHKIDYTIIGSPVNLAARLQSHARAGTVLISEETWQLVDDSFECIAQPPVMVKGINEPVRTWMVASSQTGDRYCLNVEHACIDVKPESLSSDDKIKVKSLVDELLKKLS